MPDDPNDLFAIVLCSHGHTPPEAIATGPKSEVFKYISQSIPRMEEEERLAQAQLDAEETERFHDEVRARAFQILGNGITRLNERIDQYEARKQARADQLQQEAEAAEIARFAAELAALPDPDQPEAFDPHPAMGDDGELTAVHEPVDTEKHDPEYRNEAVTGLLPKELDKGAPPALGQYVPTTPPQPKYRDPAVIGGP
jgi:hypothetical protein